jgi:hypothetical protein
MRHRTKQLVAGLLAVVFITGYPASLAAANDRVVRVPWDDISPLVIGHTVKVPLPNSNSVKGEVVAVHPNEISILVTKTSDSVAYPEGQITIPRSSITTLEFTKGTIRWRVIGTISGVVGGLFLGTALAFSTGGAAAFLLVPLGGSGIGHFLGRDADLQITRIEIIQNASGEEQQ